MMLLYILRAVFVLLMCAVVMAYITAPPEGSSLLIFHRDAVLLGTLGLAGLVIAVDMLMARKSLMAISGLFFGLLVGLLVTYAMSMIVYLLIEAFAPMMKNSPLLSVVQLLIGVISCYLAVSFILQTKDDIRFVIPYVEFSKQIKGTKPLILDTSVIIDGRIADIAETRIIGSPVIVPRFILVELHQVADSADRLKRARGRRGMDVLKKLQGSDALDLQILDGPAGADRAGESVDHRLLSLAREIDGRVVTNDYNLNKMAQLRHVEVININDLANAVKPIVLPGEQMTVRIIKPGEEAGQGVGYLDDGTMVVVEQARERINEQVEISVTSVLQTSAGRMIFGRPADATEPFDRNRRRTRTTA